MSQLNKQLSTVTDRTLILTAVAFDEGSQSLLGIVQALFAKYETAQAKIHQHYIKGIDIAAI